MKRYIATLAITVFATSTMVAAQSTKKKSRPPVEPTQSYETFAPQLAPIWAGFYGGLSVGYGFGESSQYYDRAGGHGEAATSPRGFLGAATVGYNTMWTPQILVGIEADLGVMNVSADDKIVYDGHVYKTSFGPWWATARGRVGYVAGNVLFYGTAGAAFMAVDEVSIGNTPGETATNASTRSGWVAGLGAEYAFAPGMTAKLEYLHMDFGTLNGFSPNREDFSFTNRVDIVRTGLNFKF